LENHCGFVTKSLALSQANEYVSYSHTDFGSIMGHVR